MSPATTEPLTRPAGSLAPLAHPLFRAVWITSLITHFGYVIQSVGASWMMSTIASAQMVALVSASVTLPIMLFSLIAGALADTVDRRKMMLAAQVFMLLVSAGLSAAAWAGVLTPWSLLSFTFLIGCGTALNGPAWQASVGEMVPRRDLAGAVTLNSMGFNLARSLGPAIGGTIVALAGAAAAFAVNAVSYIGLIVVLVRWKPPEAAPGLARESLAVAMSAGVRYAAMSPRLKAVMIRAALFGAGGSGIPALMPLVARHTIGGGPVIFGLLLGAFGAGAVAAAFAGAKIRRALTSEALVRVSCAGFAFAAVVAAFSPWLWLTMPALMLAGAGWVLTLSTLNVTVQMSVPRWVVARALSLYQMAAFGGMAAGAWTWGAITEEAGLAAALCGSAAVLGGCILAGLRMPLPPADDLNLDPLSRWTEPETAVPVDARTGPVVVTIEYSIAENDIPAFLAAMAERRRVRRRDGARHWTLLRDLADPALWIERYHLPTWLDYVRHNLRMTQADAAAHDRLRALHRGPGRPRVRRLIERPVRPGTLNVASPETDEPPTPTTPPAA